LFVKCLLGTAVVGVMLWRALRQGSGLIAACAFALLVALALGNHWSLRPQIASYVCFTLLLGLLSYCFEGWEGDWRLAAPWLPNWIGQSSTSDQELQYSLPRLKLLWLVPPLFVIWTNSHGGFLAGLLVYLTYLTLRGVEAVSHKGREADGLVVRFGLMGAAAIAATFLNPYGPLFHIWLFNDLKVPRPEIVEWHSPELFNTQFFPFWLLLVASVGSLVGSRKPRDFTQVVILGLILWQSLVHHRHIAFLAIACGWWLPMHWDSLLVRLGVSHRFKTDEELKFGWAPPENTAFTASFPLRTQQIFAASIVLAICITTGRLSYRLTTLKVERDQYPVAAFDYIARQGLTGKMVCTFNWAQYAIAAFGPHDPGQPGILVQVDGRCRTSYSQEMLDMHFDFLMGQIDPRQRYRDPASGPFDPTRVLNVERPDLVLISRLQQPSVEVMQQQKDRWTLLYQDGLAQLWGRSSRYNDPNSAFYVEPRNREVGESAQGGLARWPALPKYEPQQIAENSKGIVHSAEVNPPKDL